MVSRIDTQKKWQEVAEQYTKLTYGHKKFTQAVQLGMALATLNEEQLLSLVETTERWLEQAKEKH
jgi:hypothetical protein